MNVNQKIAVVVLLQLMLSSTGHTASGAVNAPMDVAGVDLSRLFFGYDDKQNIIEEIREQVEMLDPIVSSYGNGDAGSNTGNATNAAISNPFNESFKTGMYLRFDSGRVQTSDGLLLHLGDGYYVYPQRWSAEALHEKLSDFKASDFLR